MFKNALYKFIIKYTFYVNRCYWFIIHYIEFLPFINFVMILYYNYYYIYIYIYIYNNNNLNSGSNAYTLDI